MSTDVDLLILGGGPAGLTAALYGARAGLRTLVLEKFSAGGQMTQTPIIENYPGFDEGIDGFSLGEKMRAGASRFGATFVQTEVQSVELTTTPKRVLTDRGAFSAKAVILATGAEHRPLGLPDEAALVGRGVAYCAACDGMFYRGKTVAVVGGGNSAASDALLLSKLCKTVYLIHRRDTLRAERSYHRSLRETPNLIFKWNRVVDGFLFDKRLSGVRLKDTLSDETEELALDGLFISIGRNPVSALFQGQVDLDPFGYVLAGEDTQTSLPGVFVAGDLRSKPLRQIVTATADGAVAALAACEFVEG